MVSTTQMIAPLALVVLTAPVAAQQFRDFTSTRFPSPNPSEYTNYVEAVDLDNDGDLDLVFANGGNFSGVGSPQILRVYINNGVGIFADESSARTGGLTGNFRGVAFGDVDGDGDEDMLLSSDFNRQPLLMMNDGNGFFTDDTGDRLPAITLSSTRGAFGDLDNDGDLDIYINNGGTSNRFGCGQNRIFINDGSGVFTDETTSRHPLGNVCQPMDVILGDVNNDFNLDVRTGNRGSNNSRMYINDGTGAFTDGSGGLPGDSACYSYDFGDMNGDGNLDLLGANAGASNRELLLKGNGDGTFVDVSNRISPNTTGDDNDSKFFDLDNDGDLDFVVAALFQSREKIYISDGQGNFTLDTGRITSINDATLDIVVADFDNDGDLDIVTAQGESGSFFNRFYLNQTGPADTLAPRVIRTEQLKDTDDNVGPYPVRVTVFDDVTSDRGFYDRGVTLHWTVNGGTEQTTPMPWMGNSLWRGELPGLPAGGVVQYWVTAIDWANNEGLGQTNSFTVTGVPVVGDVDGDGDVDFADLLSLLGSWGPCPGCPADFDGDDLVGFSDLIALLANWG